VQQPLTYRFYLNDGRGEEWKVTLIHPPVVESIKFEQTPPAYTGQPSSPVAAGALSLLAGTKLKITGRANEPIQSAKLATTDGQKETRSDMMVDADRRSFSGELTIPAKGLEAFSIVLKNDSDLESQGNTRYGVDIVPDKPPEIEIAEGQPEKVNYIVRDKPRLRFTVRDDWATKQVFLCVQADRDLGEGEEPNPDKALQIPIPISKPAAGLTFNMEWQQPSARVDWAEGNSFHYWIKAVDNNNVTGPGVSYTEARQWSVVSEQTKRDELAEAKRKLADLLNGLSDTQKDMQKDLGDTLKTQGESK